MGIPETKFTIARSIGDSRKLKTTSASAVVCIHVPVLDTSDPNQNSVKSRERNDSKVPPRRTTARVGASTSASSSGDLIGTGHRRSVSAFAGGLGGADGVRRSRGCGGHTGSGSFRRGGSSTVYALAAPRLTALQLGDSLHCPRPASRLRAFVLFASMSLGVAPCSSIASQPRSQPPSPTPRSPLFSAKVRTPRSLHPGSSGRRSSRPCTARSRARRS